MTGTILNVLTVVIGGFLGMLFGSRLPEKLRHTVVAGLGLFTLAYGVKMFTQTQNSLIVVMSLLFGVLLGEWLKIEEGLEKLGRWLEARFMKNGDGASQARFIRGFLTASLVFCIGPMAILGSIQDGLTGDYQTLAIKAILDGFAALAFASSLGVGVVFSILPLFVYQGGISLLAAQVQSFMTADMMTEMSATGGVLLLGIALSSLLEIKHIRVGNFLPALLIAPLLVWVVALLGFQLP